MATHQAIIFVGDVHRKIGELEARITQADLRGAALIQCGDFGIGFHEPRVEEQWCAQLNAVLRARELNLYVLRGNHDDPAYFGPGTRLPSYGNLHFVPDSSFVRVGDEVILCVGGGISIDRTSRTPGKSYWSGEQVLYEPELLARLPLHEVTMVATHSSPAEAEPHGNKPTAQWWLEQGIDPSLQADIDAERAALSRVWAAIKKAGGTPRHWVYGHFHYPALEEIDGTLFRMLPELEMWMVLRAPELASVDEETPLSAEDWDHMRDTLRTVTA
jgi:predicted phosphodiesterase